jgi:stage IV sporulation protein FB
MRDNSQWSLYCGLWGSVRVYVHASLLVAFVAIMYFASQSARLHAQDDGPTYGLITSALLLFSVGLHELGHAFAAWRLGGSVDLVVLGPLGGMQAANVPREPHREVTVALAGPAVHIMLLLAIGPALLIHGVTLGEMLFDPLGPEKMLNGSLGLTTAKIAFWLNWLLLLINLAPAPAVDGGRALRSVLWPVMGYRGAIRTVSRSGMLVALLLCLMAILVHDPVSSLRTMPKWLPLILLAIFYFFSSQQDVQKVEDQDQEDDLFGYDFSQGFTSLERPQGSGRPRQPGPMRRWLQQRQEMKERRLRELEAEEERRVDDVLIRVKEVGIDALSPEDRSLLHRVAARYRNRLQS